MGAIGGVPRRLWGALFHSDNVPMTDAHPPQVSAMSPLWATLRKHLLVYPRRVWALLCITSVGLLSFGLYLQHVVGLEPCPMCIVQRYAMTALALIALVGCLISHQRAGQFLVAMGVLGAGYIRSSNPPRRIF